MKRSLFPFIASFYLFCLTFICAYQFRNIHPVSLFPSFFTRNQYRLSRAQLLITSDTLNMRIFDNFNDPKPGAPRVIEVNKEKGYADIRLLINELATMQAHKDLIGIFQRQNEKIDKKAINDVVIRPSMTKQDIYQAIGEEKAHELYFNLLQGPIQMECKKSQLPLIGTIKLLNFDGKKFNPGKNHVVEVRCDLWPEITYSAPQEYKGLQVTVAKSAEDIAKKDRVKLNIRERYKQLTPTAASYQAQAGDVLTVNMQGYALSSNGGKGEPLPAVAAGNGVEIELETGKFMEGMVEQLIGTKVNEKKEVKVVFPNRMKGPGAALSGKEAIFEIEVLKVSKKTLPDWNEQLANSIRPGMSLSELESEVDKAVEGDAMSTIERKRNDGIAEALVQIAQIKRLPESLVEETAQMKFQDVLLDFKQQGSSQEEIEKMATPEKYQRFKEISKGSIEKAVKLGIIFNDITEKEKISVTQKEIQDQLDILIAQTKQREPRQEIDTDRAREEIVNTLLKKKVFDIVASFATINYVEG
eukprot:gene7720-8338_t